MIKPKIDYGVVKREIQKIALRYDEELDNILNKLELSLTDISDIMYIIQDVHSSIVRKIKKLNYIKKGK